MATYFKIGFLLLTFLALCSSCKSKEYTFASFEGKRMAIGSSGGFTGATTKYYLFENGQLFKTGKTGYQELTSLDKDVIQQQFNNYYTLGFDKMQINDPGNMSYFIMMNPDSHKTHMLKWGGGSVKPTKELEQYYNLLSALIKKSSPKNATNTTSTK